MNVKVHFFHSHVNYFPENLEAMIEEQGESFHQDIKAIKKIPGMLEYQHVGKLLKGVDGSSYSRKTQKRQFLD